MGWSSSAEVIEMKREIKCIDMSKVPQRHMRPTGSAGFSLLELITVLMIIGVMTGIASGQYTEYRDRTVPDRAARVVGSYVSLTRSYAIQRRSPVTLAVDPGMVSVGDRLTLTVRIAKAEDIGHVPFHITHDPAVLRFERGEEGGFLRSDSHPTVFFAAAQATGDAVVVGLSRLGRDPGANGEGELCTLEFTAVGSGDAKLAFSRATVRDSTNTIVISAFRPTRLVVR